MTRIILRSRLIAPAAAAGGAAALLAGCATQPAYPIAPGGSAGATGRAETTVRPQYPIAPGGSAGPAGRAGELQVPVASAPPQARPSGVQVPVAAVSAPPAEEAGPRVAAAPVESSTLAPPSETAPPVAQAVPAATTTAVVPGSAGLGYAELRRREAEQAHAAAVERRRRAVAAKAKSYLPEKREPGTRAYTLAKGDTLYGVGRRFGLSPKAVASENDLKLSGTLHPGAEISLPEDAKDGGAETGAKGRYVVTPGKLIAPTRAERAAALARAEKTVPLVPDLAPEPVQTAVAPPPAAPTLRPAPSAMSPVAPTATAGERPATAVRPAPGVAAATSPPPARVYTPAPPAPAPAMTPPAAVAQAAPATPSSPRPYATLGPQGGHHAGEALPSSRSGGRTAADAQAAFRVAAAREAARGSVTDTAPSAMSPVPSATAPSGRGRFVWPVRGTVISTFGPKGPGQRNDGVDIAAVDGEAVRAAAPGEVVYAGHDVAALGNLVAVKHADGWVTIYGNLQRITVHPRDRVVQGGQVGLAGASGEASRPQVHFEVRYAPTPADKARPVDPQTVLPAPAAAG